MAGTKDVCYNIEITIDSRQEYVETFFGLFNFTNTTKLKLMEYYGSRVTTSNIFSDFFGVLIIDTSVAGWCRF